MAADAKFVDCGAVTVYDTNSAGTKRRDKNGKEWSGGSGTFDIAGVTYKVYVTLRKGGRGGTVVGLSLIVPNTMPHAVVEPGKVPA